MFSKTPQKNDQVQMVSIEQLVPQDHLLRKIDSLIDFNFIYDLVEDKYCPDNGRPSIDPVKVTRSAIQNAASASAMLLTTEAGIVDIKEENPAPAMPAGGGMGMM